MSCLRKRSKLNYFGSLNRRESRDLIERYCNIANLLPIQERLLFFLYYRDGYSAIEISQLIMKHHSTVTKRLKVITKKLTELCENKA